MNSSIAHIFIADDEVSVRDSVGYALEQEGFRVTPAVDGTDAESKLLNDGFPYDLLILDIMMPGRSGLDICREVRAAARCRSSSSRRRMRRSTRWSASRSAPTTT